MDMEKAFKKIREIIGDPEKADAVIQVILQMEKDQEQTRRRKQADGIAAAKERGVRFGRPPLQMPKNFAQIYDSHKKGLITGMFAANILGISQKSYRKLVAQYEESQNKTE